jgi:AraC-like DNA-binding protein
MTYLAGGQIETVRERILPDGGVTLWINLNEDEFRSYRGPADHLIVQPAPGTIIAGPSDRSSVIEIEAGRSHLSVSLATGGAGTLIGAPLPATRNELVPLGEIWGQDGASLRERVLGAATPDGKLRVLEATLLERLKVGRPSDPAVLFAGEALSAGASVSDVSAQLGLLPKTLRRRFTDHIGLTPKRFARVQRLQRLVRSIQEQTEVDWATVAARHGYCDQSHLVDDFRDLVGVTPTTYLRHRSDGATHLRLDGPEPAIKLSNVAGCNSRNHSDAVRYAKLGWGGPEGPRAAPVPPQ